MSEHHKRQIALRDYVLRKLLLSLFTWLALMLLLYHLLQLGGLGYLFPVPGRPG